MTKKPNYALNVILAVIVLVGGWLTWTALALAAIVIALPIVFLAKSAVVKSAAEYLLAGAIACIIL